MLIPKRFCDQTQRIPPTWRVSKIKGTFASSEPAMKISFQLLPDTGKRLEYGSTCVRGKHLNKEAPVCDANCSSKGVLFLFLTWISDWHSPDSRTERSSFLKQILSFSRNRQSQLHELCHTSFISSFTVFSIMVHLPTSLPPLSSSSSAQKSKATAVISCTSPGCHRYHYKSWSWSP